MEDAHHTPIHSVEPTSLFLAAEAGFCKGGFVTPQSCRPKGSLLVITRKGRFQRLWLPRTQLLRRLWNGSLDYYGVCAKGFKTNIDVYISIYLIFIFQCIVLRGCFRVLSFDTGWKNMSSCLSVSSLWGSIATWSLWVVLTNTFRRLSPARRLYSGLLCLRCTCEHSRLLGQWGLAFKLLAVVGRTTCWSLRNGLMTGFLQAQCFQNE